MKIPSPVMKATALLEIGRYTAPVVLLALVAFTSVSRCDLVHVVIDTTNGNDTLACCLDDTPKPCKTLNFAFAQCRNNFISFDFNDTMYFLNESVPPFSNLDTLSITYTADLDFKACATVSCEIGVGLAFVNVSNITISNIVFQNCSGLRNSTSRNYSNTDNTDTISLSKFYVGLYFYLCNNFWIDSTTVQDSFNAIGVVMYDTTGDVIIADSNFFRNSVLDPSISVQGGGGFYVEFTYCAPGDIPVSLAALI